MDNQELVKLKNWFLQIKRVLPWRENINPYRVWISEIMLQQTRVSTVVPYFMRWMEVFPNVEILAASSLEKVIKLWEGLGYYSRARSIHKTAQIIALKYKGVFPTTIQELEKLPGIGSYTSRALLCFTSKMPVAPVDGNVTRVLARVYSIPLDITTVSAKKELQILADQLVVEDDNPHIIGEGLIELGALVCQKIPLCSDCPIQSGCSSFRKNRVMDFPVKKSKIANTALDRSVFLIIHNESILVRKETGTKIMADLWQLPYIEGIVNGQDVTEMIDKQFGLRVIQTYPFAREVQSFTRYRVSLYPIQCIVEKKHPIRLYNWVSLENVGHLSFCSGHRRILQKMFSNQSDKN